MDALTLTALAAVLTKEAKDRRNELSVGKHTLSGQVTLDVQGVLSVESDHSYQPTTSIPLKTALALFIRYSGVTGPTAMDALVRAMNEALEINAMPKAEQKTAIEAIKELADLNKAEKTVLTGLAELPAQPRKGAVKAGKVTVTEPKWVLIEVAPGEWAQPESCI